MPRTIRDAVNVGGRWYPRGMSAADVGDAAALIGAHNWDGEDDAAPAAPPAAPEQPVEPEVAGAAPEAGDSSDAVPAQPKEGGDVDDKNEGGQEVVDPTPAEAVEERQAVEAGNVEADLKPPARSGRGATEAAWRDYAKLVDVDVSKAEGRDGVIAFIEAAGKRVE